MKIAVFDLDGTIADTLNDLADAVNYGLETLGFPVHECEKYKYMVGNGAKTLCFRALPDDKKEYAEKLHELFHKYYSEHFLDRVKLYPEIKETLTKLSENNVMLAVATNKPQIFAVKMVSALLPDIKFIKVLGGCEERPKKPYPDIIYEILECTGFSEAFMVGDSNVDIDTAKNAGITSIGCAWGFRGHEELIRSGADFIAETPNDIAEFILKGES